MTVPTRVATGGGGVLLRRGGSGGSGAAISNQSGRNGAAGIRGSVIVEHVQCDLRIPDCR